MTTYLTIRLESRSPKAFTKLNEMVFVDTSRKAKTYYVNTGLYYANEVHLAEQQGKRLADKGVKWSLEKIIVPD